MSQTQTPVMTADQPSIHQSNIFAHPGSTFAGVGIALAAAGQVIASGSLPTSSSGWITLGVQLAMAVLAALGK